MILYIGVFLVIALLAFINLFYENKYLFALPFGIIFCILFALAAFRYETGPDYPSYEIFYNELDFNLIGFLEPLFVCLTVLLREGLGLGYQSLLITIAFIAITSKFWFIARTVDYWFFALLLYFANVYLTGDFGQIRQGIAIGFSGMGFFYLVSGKRWLYLLFVLLAIGFHFSAVICLLAPFIIGLKWAKNKMILVWCLSLITGLIMKGPLLQPILNIVLPASLASKVLGYLEGDAASLGLSLGILIRFLCLIVGLIALEKHPDIMCRKYLNLYFLGGILLFLFNFNATFASRLGSYFLFFDFVILSYAIKKTSSLYYKLAIFLCFSMINFYTLIQQITSPDSALVPYKTIFFR